MQDRICLTCRNSFTPRSWNQCYCSPEPGQRKSRCAKAVENAAYAEARLRLVVCEYCGTEHRRFSRRNHNYCGPTCQHAHRALRAWQVRFFGAPSTTQRRDHRNALRTDPCSYCAGGGGGIDHIEPRGVGGTDGSENLTGCCHHCNARKTSTPLLIFMLWDLHEREFAPYRNAVASFHRARRAERFSTPQLPTAA